MLYYENDDREENKEGILGALTYGFYMGFGGRIF